MNVFGKQLLTNLCQHFKESLIVIERYGFHTSTLSYTRPYKGTFRYVPILVPQEKITNNPLKALKTHRTGGRGPDGRIWNHRRAGGNTKKMRIVDNKRTDLGNGEPRYERVVYIRYDPCRTANIAAVVSGISKRFIVATENMKPGDLIKTSTEIPEVPVKPNEGDSYPLGALAVNTIVHNIERLPGEGGSVALAAGSSAQIVRKVGGQCVIKMPSGKEMSVALKCMASVGRVSNVQHGTIPIGSAKRLRWFGIRPRSGLRQKKTGYHGRKLGRVTPTVVYDKPPVAKTKMYRYTI